MQPRSHRRRKPDQTGEELEWQIDQRLARIHISPRFKEWAIEYLHELHEMESESRNGIIEAQHKAYTECLRQIDNMVKLKTSAGNSDGALLSDEEYGRQRVELLKEKAALEELLRDAGHRVEQWLTLSEKMFEFACTARERFAKGDHLVKKQILMAIGSNLILNNKKLSFEAKEPFFILETSPHPDNDEFEPIEPINIGHLQGHREAIVSSSPGWGAIRYDARTRNQDLVKSIYYFFRSECVSKSFKLSDWYFLDHAESMDVERN